MTENKIKEHDSMTSVGIVVEYNPFHNGHKYHLKKAKEMGDIVIAVMSGDFVQRGEPAFLNKWKRCMTALLEGVDIIAELPVFYSCQSAEIFAKGAVGILNILEADKIIFGSESSDTEKLKKIIELEKNEKFLEKLQENLKKGSSYPTAYNKEIENFLGKEYTVSSNDILGIEYIRAVEFWQSKTEIYTLKREGTGYHSYETSGNIASASRIRKMVEEENDFDKIKKFLPEKAGEILFEEVSSGKTAALSQFYNLIRYAVLTGKENLKNIQDMEIGFENRLYEAALVSENFEDFMNKIITKRFTIGRVQRVLIHVLLGITKDLTENVKKKIPYVRIMGFSQKGREYLKNLEKDKDTKIITGLKNIQKILSEEERKILELNERAGKIYNIINPYLNRNAPMIYQEETK